MRSTTAGELTTLAKQEREISIRVKVKNGSGTWIDRSDWVEDVAIERDIDQPIDGLTVMFRRDSGTTLSLAPLMESSTLNRLDDGTTYSPALDVNREITVEVATTAIGAAIVSGPEAPFVSSDYKMLFVGTIDTIDSAHSPISVSCRDKGAILVDRWVEALVSYGSTPGVALETVMQQVLDATLTSGFVPLYTPVSPSYLISPPYVQQKQTLMDAMQSLAQLPGWDARYRWDDGTSTFRFTLSEPPRSKTVPDHTFGPDQYFDVTRLELDLTNIKNVIEVKYPDAIAGGHLTVTVFDTPSITKYGRRFFLVQEPDGSPISTNAEATAMADAILWDLKDPKAEFEVDMPFSWPADLWDLYRFSNNSVHFNTNQDWAVVSISHHLSKGRHRTKLQVRGQPAGGYASWRGRANPNNPRPGEVGPEAKIEIWGPPSATQANVLYTASGGTQPYTYQRRLDVDGISTGTYSAPAALGAGEIEWITIHQYRATRVFLRVTDATGLVGNADPFFIPGETPATDPTPGKPTVRPGARARVTATTATTLTVRVAVADPYPQGANTATITYLETGTGAATSPASGGTVTPAATLTEAASTYIDYTVTRPAFGVGAGRITFTVTAANRTSDSDAVDVPEVDQHDTAQGTVAIDSNGNWDAVVDGPANALSFRWTSSTSSFPVDATVTSSGTLVTGTGRLLSIAGGPLTLGQNVFITIIPFSAVSGGGVALPSIHIQGSYQTTSGSRTSRYAATSFFHPTSGNAQQYNRLNFAYCPQGKSTADGTGTPDEHFTNVPVALGMTITAFRLRTYTGNTYDEVAMLVYRQDADGSSTQLGSTQTTTPAAGYSTLTVGSLTESASAGRSYLLRCQTMKDTALGIDTTRMSWFEVDEDYPNLATGL